MLSLSPVSVNIKSDQVNNNYVSNYAPKQLFCHQLAVTTDQIIQFSFMQTQYSEMGARLVNVTKHLTIIYVETIIRLNYY